MTRPYYESLIDDWRKRKGVWRVYFDYATLNIPFWQSELTDRWRDRDKTDRFRRRIDGALYLEELLMADVVADLERDLKRLKQEGSYWRRFKVSLRVWRLKLGF